jgi:hypothetical protein
MSRVETEKAAPILNVRGHVEHSKSAIINAAFLFSASMSMVALVVFVKERENNFTKLFHRFASPDDLVIHSQVCTRIEVNY